MIFWLRRARINACLQKDRSIKAGRSGEMGSKPSEVPANKSRNGLGGASSMGSGAHPTRPAQHGGTAEVRKQKKPDGSLAQTESVVKRIGQWVQGRNAGKQAGSKNEARNPMGIPGNDGGRKVGAVVRAEERQREMPMVNGPESQSRHEGASHCQKGHLVDKKLEPPETHQLGSSSHGKGDDLGKVAVKQSFNGIHLVVKNFIQKKAADSEIGTLKKRNKDLEAQIASAESRNSRATSAHGVYARSEADPVMLQKVATDIKKSLSDFAATLGESMDPKLKHRFRPKEIKLNRVTDIRFAIQAELCSLAFEGLWETDDYYFYQCLPEYANLEKSQEAHFNRYKHIKSLAVSDVLEKLEGAHEHELRCGQKNCVDACSGSLAELRAFFRAKYEKLMKMDKLAELSTSNRSRLKPDFLQLLINVWLAHRLTLSFEQPATLFKVRRGKMYVPDHMDPAMDPEDSSSDAPMIHRVGFMIIPGFRVGKGFIKSVVYLEAPETAGPPPEAPAGQ